ncbi:MAG: class I SAM-dependent methyltransferase [Candidatus Odinarchaeum yellowstonii]|uniref:Class I SAM-dependent methyltransferase n=1 Tax=Odinarchaeota yellowstonii (strain LCB_4) TaxID=1841599 RepID=A0AAF0D2J9_ODILC|nr:MAG: class I SAM-dependent methyltransferase [Candidatus Odinarchaeum yellowstonii]
MFADNPLVEDLDIPKLARGLTSYIKRVLIQTTVAEGLPDILNDYKSILELANYMNIKDSKLFRELIISLVKLGVVEQKGDLFKWIGGEVRVTREEEEVKTLADPWIKLLQLYFKKLPDMLKGKTRIQRQEPGIWDSIYSTPLYQALWINAMKTLNITSDSTVLEVGCKTGWSTINLLKTYEPKNIIAVDFNQDFLSVAEDNISNILPDKRFKVTFIRHDFTGEVDFTGLLGDVKPDKIIVSYLFHWYNETDYLNIISNLKRCMAENADIVFLQPHIAYRNQTSFFQLPLYVEEGFKGYPLLETLANSIITAGLTTPKREFNLYLYSKNSLESAKPLKISADPPKYCKICGGILQENAFFCAYCRNIVDFNVNLPLL